MKALARHSLIAATVRSGLTVMEKSASASPEQKEVLGKTWPSGSETLTKKATLSRMLATGAMVEEAEQGKEEQAAA